MLSHLEPNVLWTAAGVFAVLTTASLLSIVRSSGGELRARIRSWWIMAGIFAFALLLGRTAMLLFLGLVSFLALKEYLSLIPTRRADRTVLFWAYLAIPIQFYWVGSEWYGMFAIFIPIYMFLFLPLPMLIRGETEGFLKAIGTLNWGLMATVYSISHAAFLLVLPAEGNPGAGGAGLLLFLVLLTEFNDVAQYMWGRTLGRHKVIPRVSPNKTWEGLLGGIVTTSLLSFLLAPVLTPLAPLPALALGAFLGAAGFVGDITISAIKRDLRIKDSGALIPGHGGILDRLDSLTYTAPLFFHIIRYFYY
ncbi:MAG TPA: phosphatidate cytidylyltransferase [Verrucomicrobiae bacterium]|jgi:phosphatidate cytidylyltransferase|nr:phosphatidate cytidylyltransferase [Verrucomicrobiae bacterium]